MKKLNAVMALALAILLIIAQPMAVLASEVSNYNQYQGYLSKALEAQQTEEPDAALGTGVTYVPTVETINPGRIYGWEGMVNLADANLDAPTMLPENGQLTVSAPAAGQWQAYVPSVGWVDFHGETGATLKVTYAKLAGALSSGIARIRSVANGESLGEMDIQIDLPVDLPATTRIVMTPSEPEAAAMPAMASYGLMTAAEDYTNYSVIINYVFADGTEAAPSYIATVAAGSDLNVAVNSPVILGYEPDPATYTINETNIQANKTFTVTYRPALVSFRVVHYQQNLNDDGYTIIETETKTGYTESEVGDALDKVYEGFYALLYDTTTMIAADGSTIVDVYYDRYYYLMSFDLDGGYGVEPIYARYGAPIEVDTPIKPGYTFAGWQQDGANVNIPDTMPAGDTTIKARWIAANTTFTVEYLLQDPDDPDKYDYIGSKQVTGTAGATVNGSDYQSYNGVDVSMDEYEKKNSSYSHADENVTVKGDGSTVVHVYYNRKEFTLKFYYAMSSGNTYYVIGGSTYYFGASATVNNKADEKTLLDYYMQNPSGLRGRVESLPELNVNGQTRGYTTGTDTSTVGRTQYTYYYITFNAKYGADLNDLWPSDVFDSVTAIDTTTGSWNGDEAFVSAWNGEHHVYYSQNNSNQTIKGKYAKLDYQLLWADQYGSPDDDTVSYLCFWENGASTTWNIPELYVYNIYVPVLEGQDTTGLTTRVYNGTTYYLRDQYNTVDDSDVNHQTQPELDGFTKNGYESSVISQFDTTLYYEAYNMYFYYTRNTYNLEFFNEGSKVESESVLFEEPLGKYDFEPPYPSTLEEGGYEFEGWYTSPNFTTTTKIDFTTETMPSNDVVLYAHWVPVTHTVEVYLTSMNMVIKKRLIDDQIVSHGDTANAPADELVENGEWSFSTWMYVKPDGSTGAFDFDMPITSDMRIYGVWFSNTNVPYVIKYAVDMNDDNVADTDAEGNVIYIAEDTAGQALAGTSKTFDAKTGSELFDLSEDGGQNYQSGYFPKTNSHNMEFNINGGNEYTFLYCAPNKDIEYTVRYLEKDTGAVLHEEKIERTRNAIVTEIFVAITGYMPDAYQKRLVISANEEENVITFWYVKDNTHAPLHIVHWIQNIEDKEDGTSTYTLYQESTDINALIGNTYSETPLTIPGFEYNQEVEGTVTSDTMTAAGLELQLFYDRIEYPYEYRFLEQGTDKVLADPLQGRARYQAHVSENAVPIAGYTMVGRSPQPINIAIENPENVAKNNVRIYYYQENDVTINYQVVGPEGCGTVMPVSETVKAVTGTAAGSTATASNGYKFVGWYTDEACTQLVGSEASYVPGKTVNSGIVDKNEDGSNKVDEDEKLVYLPMYESATYYAKFEVDVADLTITKSGLEDGDSAIFTVSGFDKDGNSVSYTIVLTSNNTSATIKGLKVGTAYSVTEQTDWSWRYDVTSSHSSGTITVGGNTAGFTNTVSNTKWLSDENYSVNVFN